MGVNIKSLRDRVYWKAMKVGEDIMPDDVQDILLAYKLAEKVSLDELFEIFFDVCSSVGCIVLDDEMEKIYRDSIWRWWTDD